MRLVNLGNQIYIGNSLKVLPGKSFIVDDVLGTKLLSDFSNGERVRFSKASEVETASIQSTIEQLYSTERLPNGFNDKISVLMPVYNDGENIGKAIESILKQTYTNFELIIYNDGSTDETQQVINSFEDTRITALSSSSNLGVGPARQYLVDTCKTRIAVWADSDDIIHNTKFELQLALLLHKEQSEKKNLIATNWRSFKDSGEVIKYLIDKPMPDKKLSYVQINSIMFEVEKSIQIAPGIGFVNYREDLDWKNKMMAMGYKLSFVPYVLHFYRKNNRGLSAQYRANQLKKMCGENNG